MTDPIFCQTRFDYRNPENGFGAYHDFFRLVELSGFPLIYVDEIDPASDNTYIYTPHNGEAINGWPGARARIIHWNLEQDGYAPIPGVRETWVSDARLAEVTGAKYVLMGSHPGLSNGYDGGARVTLYNVIMLAYMTARRVRIHQELSALGVVIAPNSWGTERHLALRSSGAMLQVHQNDGKNYAAPQRFALAAAYRLPVITEHLDHRGAFRQSLFLMSDYANLPQFTHDWACRNEARILEDYGWNLHRFLCEERTFRREVEGAL